MDTEHGARSEPRREGEHSAPLGVALQRTIHGGYGGLLQSRVTVFHDGTLTVHDTTRSAARSTNVYVTGVDTEAARDMSVPLTAEQLQLVHAVCARSGFRELDRFVHTPRTRTDATTWTYQVDDHQVSIIDPDRAGPAVPPAIVTINTLIDGLVDLVRNERHAGAPIPPPRPPMHHPGAP